MQTFQNEEWNGKLKGKVPITRLRHAGDRENSEYFINCLCLQEEWIIYYLIKNLSRAHDKKGQRGSFSGTVNTLYTAWDGSLGGASFGERGSSPPPDYKSHRGSSVSWGAMGTLKSGTETCTSPWIQSLAKSLEKIGQSSDDTHNSNAGLANKIQDGFGFRRYDFKSWIYHIAPCCASFGKASPS